MIGGLMKKARVVFKLHFICPECGKQNGLRGLTEREDLYIDGPAVEIGCKRCGAEVKLKSAR
jgi:transcription elongation factor Elf1